jgi:fermentation-respiration switch protein FrsA (DUF1100 family)
MGSTIAYLYSASESGQVNSYVDENSDGRLNIASEIVPVYEKAYGERDPDQSPNATLPASSVIADYLGPILVQQGGRDGYVSPDNADIFKAAFGAAHQPDYTIILYPELGHALGWTPSRFADTVEDIDPEPLADLVNWLDAHVLHH